VHQLFVGGDWKPREGFSVNLGTGFDVGGRGPGVGSEEPLRVGLGNAYESLRPSAQRIQPLICVQRPIARIFVVMAIDLYYAEALSVPHPDRVRVPSSRVVVFLLAIGWLTGAALRLAHLYDVKQRSPDENVYAAQATAMLERGMVGTRAVVRTYLGNPALWPYPPPTRVGYMFLIAAAMKLTGAPGQMAGAYVSFAASLLTLALVVPLGLRFFGDWITVFAVFFLAVFPADLVIARRCWSDSVLALTGVLLMYCTLLIRADARRWLPLVALAALGSVCVLIKETSAIVYGPCLLCAVFFCGVRQRNQRRVLVLMAAAVAGAGAAMAILASCTGGIGVPFTIIQGAAHGNATLPYPLLYYSGPGYLMLMGFEVLSPLTANLAVIGLLVALIPLAPIRPKLGDRRGVLVLLLIAGVLLAVFMLVPHWMNLRYVSAAYAPLCLFAGVGLWQLFVVAQRNLQPFVWRSLAVLGVAAVVVSSMRDYTEYEKGFVRKGTNDLAIRTVLAVARSSP